MLIGCLIISSTMAVCNWCILILPVVVNDCGSFGLSGVDERMRNK